MEFMREFPRNVRELAKEIAAFASSNSGTILIGVADDGDVAGLPATSPSARDELVRRIEGVCTGMVQPAVTPRLDWAVEDGKTVLVLTIPRGQQPVYYCNHVAYVRQLTQARPAEPQEVIERVAEFLNIQAAPQADEYAQAIVRLVFSVAVAQIAADEIDERKTNPWLDEIRSHLHTAAGYARSVAAEDVMSRRDEVTLIRSFASAADSAADYRLSIGAESWSEFRRRVQEAGTLAQEINETLIARVTQDEAGIRRNLADVRQYAREIAGHAERIHQLADGGRLQATLSGIATIGANVLHRAVFPLHRIPEELHSRLVSVARSLHLLEVRRTYGSRVETLDDLQDRLEEAASELLSVADDASRVMTMSSETDGRSV